MFYEDLYSCKDFQLTDINLYDILQSLDVNTLSIEDSNAIEGPMKYQEASHVLKAMSNNCSPGSDGFSAEFFQNVLEKLGNFILRSINDVFKKVYFQLLKGKEL